MIMGVNLSIAAMLLLGSLPPLAGAVEPQRKEEAASARLALDRPDEGSVFADVLRNLRGRKEGDRPFGWKEVDEKIDKWFAEAETGRAEDFKKHAANWGALREQSKRDARVALLPVKGAWKDSVNLTAAKFQVAETDFYDRKPALLIGGTYRYFEGKREISGVEPGWELDHAKLLNVTTILGEDTYDSGAIVLKAAGMNHPMFSLKCLWKLSLEASIDPESLDVRTLGSINTPTIRAWIDPRFDGKSKSDVTLIWEHFTKSSTQIGNMRISTSSGLATGFTYSALGSHVHGPELEAGVKDPAVIE
jgi:hypothetical protein